MVDDLTGAPPRRNLGYGLCMSEQPTAAEPEKTIAQLMAEYQAITKARDEAHHQLMRFEDERTEAFHNWKRWDRQHDAAGRALLQAIEDGKG